MMRFHRSAFGLFVLIAAAAQASNPGLFVVAESGGPNVKVYGTNPTLTLTPMMAGAPMDGLPEEFIVTTPPYEITSVAINPGLGGLRQPFGPLAKGAAVFTIPLDIDANAADSCMVCSVGPESHGCGAVYYGHDIIVIGSGPGIVPPQVQVWMNYSNNLGRAERDSFRKVVQFPVPDFGAGYSAGLHVVAGDFNGDGNMEIAVGRRNGESRIAFYSLDGSQLGPWATLTEFRNAPNNDGANGAILAAGDALSEYVLPQTGTNELVAYPEAPASYNGGVRLATQFYYSSPLFNFQYSVLATAPGKGFKPWVKIWFLHDASIHTTMPVEACAGPAPYCFPEDVALAQAYSPFVISEFLAFPATFKGGVNLAVFPDELFSGPGTVGPQNGFFGNSLLCGQGSEGGTVNIFAQALSPAFDKVFSFKPLGATFHEGVSVTSADRNLDYYPDIVVFPTSTQSGVLANARSLRIVLTAQGEKIVEDTLLRFKPFGNTSFRSSP